MVSKTMNKQDGIGISEIANQQKDKAGNDLWLCPLCGIVRMKYGTSCKEWPECGNELHATGEFYKLDTKTKESE